MNKAGFIELMAEKLCITKKESKKMVDAMIDGIAEVLASGEELSLVGLGKFGIKETSSRVVDNPLKPGESLTMPSVKFPSFRAGETFKRKVNHKIDA